MIWGSDPVLILLHMCDRYKHLLTWPQAVKHYKLTDPAAPAGYRQSDNIAPSEKALVIRESEQGRAGAMLHWGIIPSWAIKKPVMKPFNARYEDLIASPLWTPLLKSRRCLVPASGYFGWSESEGGKRLLWIGMADGAAFAMAGVWDRWLNRVNGEEVETFAIVTTTANELIAGAQERMPVILSPGAWSNWLGTDGTSLPIQQPYPAERMKLFPAGLPINRAKGKGAKLGEHAR